MCLTPYKCSRNIRRYFSVPLIYSLTYATITTTKGKLKNCMSKFRNQCKLLKFYVAYLINPRHIERQPTSIYKKINSVLYNFHTISLFVHFLYL